MHDVFVRLLSHRDQLDDRAMAGLLFQMATQVSLNRLRTRRRRPESPDDALLHVIAEGEGTAVLEGAFQALGHLVRMLQENPPDEPFRLGPGSLVTTGTLTDAQPLLKGQHWATGVSSSAPPAIASSTLAAPLVDLSMRT